MAKDSRKSSRDEAVRGDEATTLETLIRQRARGLIDAIVEEELAAALGAASSARVGSARQGYRHGTRERTLTTSLGPTTVAMPRARVRTVEGATTEWQSALVRRYQRRSERVDEAILGVYLSGTNTRRIKGALAPLLRGGPLSKDAVSRLVGRLADDFETWRRRELAEDQIQYLVMDGWYPKVRIGKRRVRVPVLVTLGVRADGQRVVLDLRLAGDESTAAWRDVIRGLVERHVGTPALAMVDGSAGLAAALREQWPTLAVQRCTTHKLRNLEAKAPVRLREELAEDYRRMIYAESRTAVEQARTRFTKKWRLRCPAVVECLDEAGDDLFTFLRFPKLQWKALRTTNALERINGEFRRRTKTQASLPGQEAVLLLLFGLLRSGHVRLRKIDGWEEMARVEKAA
ncbi:MAG TPA: IS256 family transposase [Gemmatimonadaceae bacterium]|jgi:transposase-like protein